MTMQRSPQGPNPQAAAPAPPPFVITHPNRADRWMNDLFYGDYGVGKTTLAATAEDIPEMRDVLFIDAESGDLSLQSRPHMDVVKITQYSQLARIYEFLRLHVRARDAGDVDKLIALEQRIKPGEVITAENVKRYKTVIIDSLTEIQKYLMYQLLSINFGTWSLDLPPETAEFKEWGQSSEMIQLLVRSFRDLPMHVIFVCSAQEVEDDRKRQLKRLNLPGKLAGQVQGFLDVVGYLSIAQDGAGNTLRRLYIESTPSFHAKNRFNTDMKFLDNPTLTDLLALNNAAPTTAPAPVTAPTGATNNATASPASTPNPRPAAPAGGTRPSALASRGSGGSGPIRRPGTGR